MEEGHGSAPAVPRPRAEQPQKPGNSGSHPRPGGEWRVRLRAALIYLKGAKRPLGRAVGGMADAPASTAAAPRRPPARGEVGGAAGAAPGAGRGRSLVEQRQPDRGARGGRKREMRRHGHAPGAPCLGGTRSSDRSAARERHPLGRGRRHRHGEGSRRRQGRSCRVRACNRHDSLDDRVTERPEIRTAPPRIIR